MHRETGTATKGVSDHGVKKGLQLSPASSLTLCSFCPRLSLGCAQLTLPRWDLGRGHHELLGILRRGPLLGPRKQSHGSHPARPRLEEERLVPPPRLHSRFSKVKCNQPAPPPPSRPPPNKRGKVN